MRNDRRNKKRDFHDEPCYIISVAARMVGVHQQTLRYYERIGLVKPSRSSGRRRLYTQREVEVIRRVKALTDELGVNLAGVQVVLRLMERVAALEKELDVLAHELRLTKASRRAKEGEVLELAQEEV